MAMAVTLAHFFPPSSSSSSSRLCFLPSLRPNPLRKPAPLCCFSPASPQMDRQQGGGEGGTGERKRFVDFPYLSAPYKDMMAALVSTVESRLGSYLLPCTLPPDVQYFHNQSNTARACLHIRSGIESSPIDFILGSWLHCELPSGALNIMSLSAYLAPSTDAPNFLMEVVQSSPTSLVLILDLPPRKDLVLHSDYLQSFYEEPQLDRHQQLLEQIPEVQPYYSSSLFLRSVVSPTAMVVRAATEAGRVERMEEIVRDHVSPVAKQVLAFWLDQCAFGEREVGENERADLAKRDLVIRKKYIEIDMATNLPRLFGQEVADRVLGVIKEVFGA
ncbi:red chlorophyll catabolite reductase isoform X2 [Diospyros lotus]|uniref:red chlorophyll catabolite reductase isoform X2 n=1 Tax=Diospyros lotus TaxID=55363 RepID=UPI00225AF2C0|nr:red chlorophyll catabolite reductase isoform X2 [Diospyros lotus]